METSERLKQKDVVIMPWHWKLAVGISMGVAISAFVFLVITQLMSSYIKPEQEWNPLGDYPVQLIKNTLPGYDVPALKLGEELTVEAMKCVKRTGQPTATAGSSLSTKGDVIIFGKFRWVSVDPGGFSTIPTEGQAMRLPGCTRITYTSPMPESVVARVKYLCVYKNLCRTTWHKDGIETPIKRSGQEGRPKAWFTGNFTIVVDKSVS